MLLSELYYTFIHVESLSFFISSLSFSLSPNQQFNLKNQICVKLSSDCRRVYVESLGICGESTVIITDLLLLFNFVVK